MSEFKLTPIGQKALEAINVIMATAQKSSVPLTEHQGNLNAAQLVVQTIVDYEKRIASFQTGKIEAPADKQEAKKEEKIVTKNVIKKALKKK